MVGNKDGELGENKVKEGVSKKAGEKLFCGFRTLVYSLQLQFTTSSRRLDGGAYCGAPVGGKCMVSKAKLVLYAFAV